MLKKIFYFFIIAILFAGCAAVSKDTYDKTVAESEARKTSLEKAQEENRRLRDENRQLRWKTDKLSRDIEKYTSERDEFARQFAAMKKEKGTLTEESQKEVGLLKKETEQVKEKIEGLTSEKEAALKEMDGLAKRVESLSAEADALKKERGALTGEAEGLKGENDLLRVKVENLSKGIEGLTSEREAMLKKLDAQTVEMEALKKDREVLAKQVEALSSEAGTAKREKETLTEESRKEIAGLKDENLKLQGKIDELISGKEAAEVLAEEIDALKREREDLLSKADYLNREVGRLKLKAGGIGTEKEKEMAALRDTYEKLLKEMKGEIEKGEIKIKQAADRLSVNMVDRVLFDSGSAMIKPEGRKILNRVGAILKGITNKEIRVDGHTDNKSIGSTIKAKYPTNWELSGARAINVVRYLQDRVGIDPKLLAASGYSKYRPVANNETKEGRAQNRRIEILLLPADVSAILEEFKSDSK